MWMSLIYFHVVGCYFTSNEEEEYGHMWGQVRIETGRLIETVFMVDLGSQT